MSFHLRWFMSTWCGLLYNRRFCAEWDKKLSRLIDLHGDSATVTRYTVILGEHEVWIENAFYAYGYLYGSRLPQKRPRVRTMQRLDLIVQAGKRLEVDDYVAQVRGLKE